MKTVWLAQPAHHFGSNAFLPYSAGRVWAYAATQPDIAEGYMLAGLLWSRDPIEDVVERMRAEPPDVLGLSTYIWNEQYNLALASAVKREWPGCLVVAGGPQIPEVSVEGYMQEHSQIDICVHGEGEEAFAAILRARLIGAEIPRISRSVRVEQLHRLPSPYLSGVFDSLLREEEGVAWQTLQETDRGCPYACSMCVWGSASLNQVRTFPMDTLNAELEWFAEREIEVVYNTDANFAMLPHHEEFADCLMAVSARAGYPRKFRAAYAKKITERVFRVAKKLSDAGLSKGATISFQSMDEKVLTNIRRLNPVQKSLAETFGRYREAGIPTYSEMIVGLPGETYDSFADGVNALLEAGQHRGIAIYPCMALPNSELADPTYRDLHGIETRRVRQLVLHGTPQVGDIPEWYDMVTATKTMPHQDWLGTFQFAAVVQALHGGGLTTAIAQHLADVGVMSYRVFYEGLIDRRWLSRRGTALATELRWLDMLLSRALSGQVWRTTLKGYGGIQWPVEEALLLRLLARRETFYSELSDVLANLLGSCQARKLVAAQKEQAPDPEAWSDLETFAREEIWYGRKGRKVKVEEVA